MCEWSHNVTYKRAIKPKEKSMSQKLDVAALKAAGFTPSQIEMLANAGALATHKTSAAKVIKYTTGAGKTDVYLSVSTGRVFIKANEADGIIKALSEGLTRFKAGEIDDVKAAASFKPTE
jgi:hypothetical protein